MLDIVKLPTPSLRERSVEIDRNVLLQEDTQAFIDEMIPTMYDDDGIGLAAPQVGNNIRVCIIGKDALPKKIKMEKGEIDRTKDLPLINPVWEKTSKKTETEVEGCLSVPLTFGKVKRQKHIRVTAMKRDGEEITFEAKNFFARVIQHEVDHLDGILFIDKAEDVYKITEEEHARNIAGIRAERNIPSI